MRSAYEHSYDAYRLLLGERRLLGYMLAGAFNSACSQLGVADGDVAKMRSEIEGINRAYLSGVEAVRRWELHGRPLIPRRPPH